MKGIPILHVEGDCIARAWELSLVELHQRGCALKTEYDKPEDPPSKDATMIITITDPLAEPMIHKDFPGGLEDLQEYVLEVTEGIKDHLVDMVISAREEAVNRGTIPPAVKDYFRNIYNWGNPYRRPQAERAEKPYLPRSGRPGRETSRHCPAPLRTPPWTG